MSDLTRLRSDLKRAESRVGHWERELTELRQKYRGAGRGERPEITRRGQNLHLVLDDAKRAREAAWQALRTEEKRLLEPAAFLRFT